jgi:effector-binding domain-containing protein
MALGMGAMMNLTEEPEIVEWPETHYVFVEKIGPFATGAPAAWGAVHPLTAAISEHNQITRYMTLYKIDEQVYRAGVSLAAEPVNLPEGLRYERFFGGKYTKFVLKGPYMNLPAASGRVWAVVNERPIPLRIGYAIEHYVSDPRVTPEEELVTEILVPTA